MLAIALILLLVLLGLGVSVAATVGALGLGLNMLFAKMPLHLALGEVAWQNSIEFLLVAIPLFILLGEILLRSGIAARMYAAIVQWTSWLPGGLMHANIGACAMFAATSGSSVATAATVGTVALPELHKYKYNERLFLGTLAAGGTLGILIPPSINIIVYALLTRTSVPQLYLAAIIPGIVLAVLFTATIFVVCLFKPEWGGRRVETSWRQRFLVLPDLLPPMAIFIIVVGSIYAGVATPTEAAALGVVAAIGLAALNRTLSFSMLRVAIEGTMKTTAVIMLIILASVFLNFVMAALGITTQITNFIVGMDLGPTRTLIVIILFYIVLGCFLETLSMMIMTIPIIVPIVTAYGYDPVWFGILVIVLVETALITPPIGVNLFVVQSIRNGGNINDVIVGSLPFVITMFLMLATLIVFPGLALWLPRQF